MFTNLLTLLALSAPASAAAPASCMGKTGTELQVCNEQRMAAQAVELATTKRQLEALEQTCSQACDSTPAAAPVRTGPSRTQIAIDGIRERLTALEGANVLTDTEFADGLAEIRAEINKIKGEKGDKGDRGPTGAVGPVGPQGPKGDDGLSMEFDLSPGGFVFATRGNGTTVWGANLGVTVGMPIRDAPVHFGVRLEGLGSYDGVSLNDGGFAIGVVTGVDIVPWLELEASGLWMEFGLDVTDQHARKAFQGLAAGGRVVLDLNPNKAPVLGFYAGGRAWFQGEDDGNVIGYAELGLHLQLGG